MKKDVKKIVVQTGADLLKKYGSGITEAVVNVRKKTKKSNATSEADNAVLSVAELAPLPSTTEEEVVQVEELEETFDLGIGDDTFFEDSTGKLRAVIKSAADGGFQDPGELMAALNALGEVANETVKYVAEQETKQEEIRAKRDVAIAQINATSEYIKAYLDKTFDERSTIFSKQFEVLDEALRTGNTEMLAMSLQSINALAAQSPFKSLADIGQVQQALSAGDTEWDI